MAVSKKAAAATAEKVENKEVQEATKPVEAKAPATKEATPKAAAKKVVRNAHDMIPCRSVTVGELTCESKKSKGIYYRWLNYDDIEEVEYQDLVALRSSRSKFLYNPQFIIMDDELAAEWGLTEVYSAFLGFDSPDELFSLPANQLAKKLKSAPQGLKESIKDVAGQYMREGRLDSLKVIDVLDKELGTDLKALL